jgi:Zn finger protein HypA/HybF involved in hydrogenase expression
MKENKMEKEKNEVPCRYCKQPVNTGIKRCPHCGTFNPSMNVKRAMVWTVATIAMLYLASFVMQVLR